jgi:hypothetical protein
MSNAFNNVVKLADEVSVKDFGAKGDGTTDDTAALRAAIAAINTSFLSGTHLVLRVPAGSYVIKNTGGAMTPFAPGVPGAIVGDGPHKTYFKLDTTFVGDLFSWSEAWQGNAYVSGILPSADKCGAMATGFTVFGSTSAASQQNIFRFYDRNDYVFMSDIDAHFINGQFFSCGRVLNQPQAYIRESQFRNLRAFYCGTSTQPAVEISSTTASGSDATNEVAFFGLNVFNSAGRGVVISNPNNFSSTRLIKFFQLRSENNTGDAVSIGLSSDVGSVSAISVYGLEVPNIKTGTYGLNINNSGSNLPYAISVTDALIGSGSDAGGGIAINAANGVAISVANIAVAGIPVTLGPNANAFTISQQGKPFSSVVSSTAAIPMGFQTPIYLTGLSGSSTKVGFVAMQVTGGGTAALRLSMDGGAASAYNTFNIASGSAYNISIQLIANDTTTSGKSYSYTLPVCYFAKPFANASTTVSAGTPATVSVGAVSGAAVSLTADTTNGGINLSFTPPTSNTDTWSVSALVTYSKQ